MKQTIEMHTNGKVEFSKIIDTTIDLWIEDSNNTYSKEIRSYKRYVFGKWIFMFLCLVVSFLVMGFSLSIGDYSISFSDTYLTLLRHLTQNIVNPTDDYVIWDLRMPRILGGVLVGSGLAVGGAAMQSMMKNPLADPYTTGISSGASFGAALAICAGISIVSGQYIIVLNAFIFSLIPTAVIVLISKMKNSSPTTMIMAGIAVMYLFNASTTIIKLWADEESLAEIFNWSVGSLEAHTWTTISVMSIFVITGILIILFFSRQLNVLATGDESAKALGINAGSLRTMCLIVVALISASIVCFTGLIGFVGLICPHIVRIFIGSDNRYLIPASAMFGSALVLLADLIGRVIIAPNVLPVGVIMAFIGGPMFLYLLLKRKKGMW